MKKLRLLLVVTLSLLALSSATRADVAVTGTVFCNANQSGVIDTNDVGVPGVLVVITNESGTFSNSAVTAFDGTFSILIPNPAPTPTVSGPSSQVFVETLDPTSLPAGSSIQIPVAITNATTPFYLISFMITPNQTNLEFTSGTGTSSTGDWLIANPECGSAGNCQVSGRARISGFREPARIFGGTILSGNPPSGQWTDRSRSLNLLFQSTSIQTVTCGTGSIEFTGTGVLSSTRGGFTRLINNSVLFTVEIQNITVGNGRRTRTVAAYYLNVTTADGLTTLELVSTDPADPTDVAPVPITSGRLNIQSE